MSALNRADLAPASEIPAGVLDKWQRAVDLVTSLIGVKAGLVTRVRPEQLEVVLTSRTPDNPVVAGSVHQLTGQFCDEVVRTRALLEVADGRAEPRFCACPVLRKGLVSYLGLPIMVAGEVFGTVCVYNDQHIRYTADHRALLEQFGQLIEADLQLIVEQRRRLALEAEKVEKLRSVDALRRELLANVSHDLRTPLASLQGYLETLLLMDGELPASERRRFVEIAVKHCVRLGRLVDDLFEVARLESGCVVLRLESCSLAELAHDVALKYALRAEAREVELVVDAPDTRWVRADLALVERALVNLVDNALRFTPAAGCVTLSVRFSEGFADLTVTDTGSGIAPDALPFVFDRYYRAPQVPREKLGAAGLGLAICKRIAELHGGSIQVESHPNQGARFTLRLPTDGPVAAA